MGVPGRQRSRTDRPGRTTRGLKRQGYGQKVDSILSQIQEDPTVPYEKLCGEYKGFYSKGVNRIDCIVYEIREGACEDGTDAAVVSRMGTHHRGMFSILMLFWLQRLDNYY